MKLTITIDLDNAAFSDGGIDAGAEEVRRILSGTPDRLTFRLSNGSERIDLYDFNGNKCGTAEITE